MVISTGALVVWQANRIELSSPQRRHAAWNLWWREGKPWVFFAQVLHNPGWNALSSYRGRRAGHSSDNVVVEG